MPKKYIVQLTETERTSLKEIIKKQKGTSTKVRRAQILLKADVNDESGGWTDQRIAEAFLCRTQTVENIRQRLVLEGFDVTVHGKLRSVPPRQKKLTGEQEAQVIALRLGEPPAGFAQWSLRLLSKRVVELGIVESISHETVRCALKQMA
jgi:hypothetical protein